MKKIIRIEISYPDCDMLNITQADLMIIQNEVLNQLSIVEDAYEGRFEIDAKIIEPINEEELDKLACEKYPDYPLPFGEYESMDEVREAFKAGYRKAKQE